jgi:hypothetical protein
MVRSSELPMLFVVVGVLAPQDRRSRWAAQGVSDVGILKSGSVRAHDLPYAGVVLHKALVEDTSHDEHYYSGRRCSGPRPGGCR